MIGAGRSSWVRRLGEPLLAASLYAAVALGVTWPLATQLGSRILGSHRGDLWFHAWGLWWMKASLLERHAFPLRTDQVNYPDGGTLLLIDPLNGILSIPFQLLFPLGLAYDLTVLLDMVLAGLGGWLLVRWLIRSGEDKASWRLLCPGALLGGLLFAFCPNLVGAIESGVSETFHVGLLAFFMYALLRCLCEASLLHGLLAGLLLFLALFANAYFGVFCGLLTLIVLLWMLLAERPQLLRWRALGGLGIAGLVFALPALPWIRTVRGAYAAPDGLVRRIPDPGHLEDVVTIHRFVADLQEFFLIRDPSQHQDAYHTNVLYLGYAALGLFLLGLLLCKQRQRLLWLAVFLVFFVLSWGPALKWGGRFVMLDGSYVELPFYYLFTRTPYLSLVSHPHRLCSVTMLPLAVMAGLGVAALRRRTGRPWIAWLFAVLAACAVLAEIRLLAPVRMPITSSPAASPAFYEQLAQDTDEYGIVVLPLSFAGMDQRRVYFYDQALHGKKLPNMVDQVVTRFVLENSFLSHLYFLEWRADTDLNRPYHGPRSAEGITPELLQQGLEELRQADFRLVVLNEAHFVPTQASAISHSMAFLRAWLGEPQQPEPGFWVWSLDPS